MSAIRKRANGLWQLDDYVRDQAGKLKRIRVSLKTRDEREAKKAARQLRRELESHGLSAAAEEVSQSAEGMTFDAWAKTWFKNYVALFKYATKLSYESLYRIHIHPFFTGKKLAEIKPEDIKRFIRVMLDKGRTKKTINNALAVLKSLFRDAHANGHVTMNIMLLVKTFKLPAPPFRYYTEKQSTAFLKVCRQSEPDVFPIFLTFFTTGMRFGEVAALTWDQIDFVRDVIVVDRAAYQGNVDIPKGVAAREVPMHPETKKTLLQYRQLRHLKGDLVFPGRLATHIMDHEFFGPMKRIRRSAGLPKITFHDMRHSYASQLVMRGVSLYIVQKLLGHKHIETTMRYAHLSPEAKDDAVQKLYSGGGLELNEQENRTVFGGNDQGETALYSHTYGHTPQKRRVTGS